MSGQVIWLPFIGFFLGYSVIKKGKNIALYFILFLILTLVASDVTSSYILKNIFNRLRPCRQMDLIPLVYSFGQKCGGKFGFVSSHAANSFALVLFSIKCLRLSRRWIYGLWIVPVLVGYSRIYLGVHYPGDILGGALVGITWAIIFSKMFKLSHGATL